MGKHWVSGIHSTNFHLFHENPILEEYSGLFDEARVAVHEWFTRPAYYNTVKIVFWSGWFLLQGINPIAVIWEHYRSLSMSRHTSF